MLSDSGGWKGSQVRVLDSSLPINAANSCNAPAIIAAVQKYVHTLLIRHATLCCRVCFPAIFLYFEYANNCLILSTCSQTPF